MDLLHDYQADRRNCHYSKADPNDDILCVHGCSKATRVKGSHWKAKSKWQKFSWKSWKRSFVLNLLLRVCSCYLKAWKVSYNAIFKYLPRGCSRGVHDGSDFFFGRWIFCQFKHNNSLNILWLRWVKLMTLCSLLPSLSCESAKVGKYVSRMSSGTGGAGKQGTRIPPYFGRSLNSFSTRGRADYASQNTTHPYRFSDLPTSLYRITLMQQ